MGSIADHKGSQSLRSSLDSLEPDPSAPFNPNRNGKTSSAPACMESVARSLEIEKYTEKSDEIKIDQKRRNTINGIEFKASIESDHSYSTCNSDPNAKKVNEQVAEGQTLLVGNSGSGEGFHEETGDDLFDKILWKLSTDSEELTSFCSELEWEKWRYLVYRLVLEKPIAMQADAYLFLLLTSI